MADASLAYDWANTSIGPIHAWPQALRSLVQMAVLTRQAICLFWGKDLNMIYNDAYAPILGEKEEGALGKPAQEIRSEVWDEIAPIVQEAVSGRGTWGEDMPLIMTRNGYEEQTYWSFSCSPIYSDGGTVGGMINITASFSSASIPDRIIGYSFASRRILVVDCRNDCRPDRSHRDHNRPGCRMA